MTCKDCGCEVIQQRAWVKANPVTKAHWTKTDVRVLQGRGLCRLCYQRLYRLASRRRVTMDAVA